MMGKYTRLVNENIGQLTMIVLVTAFIISSIGFIGVAATAEPESITYELQDGGENTEIRGTLYQYDQLDTDEQEFYDQFFHGNRRVTVEYSETLVSTDTHTIERDGTMYVISASKVLGEGLWLLCTAFLSGMLSLMVSIHRQSD